MTGKMDLKTQRATSIYGGEYGQVEVDANLKVCGSLKCDALRCTGNTKIEGDLSCAGDFSCGATGKIEGAFLCGGRASCAGPIKFEGQTSMGEGSFTGNLVCEGSLTASVSFRSSASVKIAGTFQGGEAAFAGPARITRGITAQSITAMGRLETNGQIAAERFSCSGGVVARGLLNADQVEITLGNSCELSDMGGSTIQVKRDWAGGGRGMLEVRTIEGDVVELENTVAQMVRGNHVRIGPGCVIRRVEYTGSLILEGGRVDLQVKLN